MGNKAESELEERVARLEEKVARLESPRRSVTPETIEAIDADTFWALDALRRRVDGAGAVMFTGTVTLPTGEHYDWQEVREASSVLDDAWTQGAPVLAALGHPVRLLLLREILTGARSVSELGGREGVGTSGQLYHHLRQLVAAGWLRTTARGQYAVPGERVVPLLVALAVAQ